MNPFIAFSFLHKQPGYSLVELMIAMTLGTFLTGGMLQLFLGSKQSYRYTQSLSRMQENARFVHQVLSQDLRMAGFSGCAYNLPVANVLNGFDSTWWSNFENSPIQGIEGDQSFPGASFCTDVSSCNSGDRISGTDAIVLLKGGNTIYRLDGGHVPEAAQFKLKTLHQLNTGSIVMICDHNHAAIMQLTNVNLNNKTLVHNTGRGTPGNCTKGLGLPVKCTAVGTSYAYPEDSIIVDYEPVAYYIGASERNPDGRSLYRMNLVVDSSNTEARIEREELSEGVYDMQISYGEDSNANRQVDRYGSVSNWSSVIAIRLELLFYSEYPNLIERPLSLPYNGGVFDAGDGSVSDSYKRRLYQVVTTTVGLRNRLP